MPRKRFQRSSSEEDCLGGWQNADCEFTQLDFSDSVPSRNQQRRESYILEEFSRNEDNPVAGGSGDQTRFQHAPHCVNPSHYLCTLLPSRKAYMTNPDLEKTMSKGRPLQSGTSSNKSTLLNNRPRRGGGIKYEVSQQDEVDFQVGQVQTEDDYWDQLMSIRSMAAPMAVKMKYKKMLQNSAAVFKGASSTTMSRFFKKRQQKMSDFKDEFKANFNLWKNPLKVIEGYYGTGIVSYFIFIRWVLMLNFLMFFLIFFFIILPPLVLRKVPIYYVTSINDTSTNTSTIAPTNATNISSITVDFTFQRFEVYENESLKYHQFVMENTQTSIKSRIQDFLQGTGWMELTVMFYGTFSPNNLLFGKFSGETHWYMLPLAYLLVTFVYFFICMIMMVRSMIDSSRENLVIHEAQFYKYFNLVFGSWDFCITNANSADLKKMSIYVDMQSNLKEDEFSARESSRSTGSKVCIYVTRAVLNIISIGILCGAGYLIYYVTIQSVELYQKHGKELDKVVVLLLEFLTPLTITFLNLVLPMLFRVMVKFEQYRPNFAVTITLFRSVFVRLASLGVLMSTFSRQITCDANKESDCVKLLCWETYVGQQLYKLVIVDFAVVMIVTFLVETPRRLIVTKFSSFKLAKLIGKPEFEITKHVLDLIYGQTLCWLGVFYCPMLPAIGFIKCIIFFYAKKFTLLHNCKPTKLAYKASRSNTFFTVVLFLAFLLSCIPFVYSLSYYPPSTGCGPFRLNDRIWDEINLTIEHWPHALHSILSFLGTAGFAIPFFIVLCLLMYYYYILSAAYKELAAVIKEQLKDEGRDKQYLLARLTQQS